VKTGGNNVAVAGEVGEGVFGGSVFVTVGVGACVHRGASPASKGVTLGIVVGEGVAVTVGVWLGVNVSDGAVVGRMAKVGRVAGVGLQAVRSISSITRMTGTMGIIGCKGNMAIIKIACFFIRMT